MNSKFNEKNTKWLAFSSDGVYAIVSNRCSGFALASTVDSVAVVAPVASSDESYETSFKTYEQSASHKY